MSKALDRIRAKVGLENCVGSCSRDGCRVYMSSVPEDRVIVDIDKAFPAHESGGKRCDFVLFAKYSPGTLLVAPIELKSGKVDSSEVIEQLNCVTAFVEEKNVPLPSKTVCRPVLIYGKGLYPAQLKTLNSNKVVFCGRKLTVKTARCGEPGNLARALEG